MNNEDDYNVNNYTDNELYDILELVNPSDSILEAKIIQMINKFKNINNRYGNTLMTFFTDIYKHFFDVPVDQDQIEGFENIESKRYDEKTQKFIEDTNAPSGYARETDLTALELTDAIKQYRGNKPGDPGGLARELINMKSTYDPITKQWISNNDEIKTIEKDPSLNIGFNSKPTTSSKPEITAVKQFDYSKGTLNPLLKQTIKRIISIDSQYREQKDTISTEFTFNLSEPLKDVVALRLYSVQIPFTWYTVGNNYGANYIYYKGSSPGIDNGDFDYKIEIAPGNYTNQTLVNALNAQFIALRTTYTDVSFGTTQITYDENACKSTITTDIKNYFNEADYTLIFPNESNLNKYPLASDINTSINPDDQYRYNTTMATSTLSAYLGFNNNNYRFNAIYSNPNTMSDNDYNNIALNVIDDNNRTFTISRRDINNSKINDDIPITLDLPTGGYTASVIINEINRQFSLNTRLTDTTITTRLTTIERKTIDLFKENEGKKYYEMHIHFNKKKDPFANVSGLTTYVTFPNETTNAIWTGTDSLLKFNKYNNKTDNYNDLNEIIAESESHQTDYLISTYPYIVLKCIKSGFTSNEIYAPNLSDNTHIYPNALSNDFIIDISNNTFNTGYNFNTYLNEINTKLGILNNSLTGNDKYGYKVSNINNDISYNSLENKLVFNFNINLQFDKSSYTITFGPVLTNLGFPSSPQDLTFDLSATKLGFNSYTLKINDIIATITPKQDKKNYNDASWNIVCNNETRTFTRISDLLTAIALEFNGFTFEGYNPINLTITNISNTVDNVNVDNITLQFNSITRTLTQSDYKVYFYDASGNNSRNSWYTNLFFDNSYNLQSFPSVDGITSIKSRAGIAGFTFYMDNDTYFTLSGVTNGLIAINNANDIKISIPKPTNNIYTRQELFNLINAQFDANPLTTGSSIYYYQTSTDKQYVHMKIKINKMFTGLDYKIVFYDQFSFVKCFVGTKSVRNVTWDSTLGWILGFRSNTEFNLYGSILNAYSTNDYTQNTNNNIVTIRSDTTMTTNIYDYFLIILDDYTQSHLNDGLVTIIPKDMTISLPSYAQTVACNSAGQTIVSDTNGNVNRLTEKQLYAANTMLNQSKVANKSYSMGPYIQDVFGLIPLKLGITAGQTYVEFGGTLQNQERVYFGPVNISRMTIKLINDRGEPVDLNRANWSFSFICEQLYNVENK